MSPVSSLPVTAGSTIRRRLMALLLLPALIILGLGTLGDYFTSIGPIEETYDQSLIDATLAIAAHLRTDPDGTTILSLPADAVSILKADSFDTIYFRVSRADDSYIAGDIGLPESHIAGVNPARADGEYRGRRIRLVTYSTQTAAGAVNITAAETLHKRERTRARTLSRALAVDLAQLALVLVILWLGVRFALEPLRNVREQIARRSARALEPLPLEAVPFEIRSIVEALNRLFATVRESSSAQRRFLESAAHQLRTPLTGIQAQLELMVADETDAVRRERLSFILSGARRLTHTTQQLLTLARSDEASNLRWEFQALGLAEVVESVVADRLAAADVAGIDLGADIEAVSVSGVSWLLNEALGNLVNNAIAHTPVGGTVTVRCGLLETAAFLEVVDTGVGIPLPERERVLERFFRASNAQGLGTGLGLAIVSEVAQLHGAAVAIGPGSGGRGTSVRLTFPVVSHPSA